MKKLILCTLALSLFGGMTLHAQDAKAEAKKKREEMMLKKYDKNGNGKLDDDEKEQMKKDRAEQMKKYDKDGDGKLSKEEREAMMADMKKGKGKGKGKKKKSE